LRKLPMTMPKRKNRAGIMDEKSLGGKGGNGKLNVRRKRGRSNEVAK